MKPFSDEQFRAYFLGRMPGAEAEIFEEECALSAELAERSQMVERELADDYLRGNLSDAERALFESNYLVTEDRRYRLRAAGSLWTLAGEQKQPPTPVADPERKTFRQTFFSAGKGFRLAFAGGAVLLIFGAAVFYLSSVNVGEGDVAAVREPQPAVKIDEPATPADVKADANEAVMAVPDERDLRPAPPPRNKENDAFSPPKSLPQTKSLPKISRQSVSNFAAFVLFAGTLRDEGEQSITIAPTVKKLNLLLSPAGEPQSYKIYRAILKTPEGGTIFTLPNSRSLNLTIAAEKLENRTYIIFLEGQNASGEFESIAEYIFRVRR